MRCSCHPYQLEERRGPDAGLPGGWRLEQSERERTWALVSARAEGSRSARWRTAVCLSPARVHQLVAGADLDALDVALGELRAAGWPAPEDPDSGEDAELGGRDTIRQRSTCARPPTGRTGPSWPWTSHG
jgi:hypothetical protein